MFADEIRDPQHLEQLRINAIVNDPEKFYNEMKHLRGKNQEKQLAALMRERSDLKRRISSAMASLKDEKTRSERLAKQNSKLKEQIAALRNSKTMRLGRAVAAPAKATRHALTDPVGFTQKAAKKSSKFANKMVDALPRTGSFGSDNSEGKQDFKSPEKRNHSTRPESFETELNRLWYQEGRVSDAATFIQTNQAALEGSSDKAKILSRRILGIERVRENGIALPARSDACAYVPEANRLMYCVHQSPVFNSNGYSTRTRGVVEGLSANGVDPVVVARPGYPWDSKVDRKKPGPRRSSTNLDGVTYVHIPGGNLSRDALDHYFQIAADGFVREAKLNRPRMIQSASNFRTAIPALIAARRVGVPFVYEVRGLWELTEASSKPGFENTERFELMRDLETLVALEADVVLAITDQVADELVERGVERDKIQVAPNAVNTRRFVPIPADQSYKQAKKIPSEGPVIGFAGSLVEYEGLDLLIEASELLGQEGIQHQVVIAGSGAAENNLKKLAADHPHAQVRFLGRLPQAEIPRLMSIFDIVACPRHSQRITELVSPLKPLEAFSAGKATLLSDVAPNVDLSGSTDLPRAATFRAGDLRSLTAELRTLIEDSEARGALGRRARLWAVEQRTWEAIGQTMRLAQAEARRRYETCVTPSRELADLTVGVIGDEFTRTTLEGAFHTVLMSRESWRQQFSSHSIDLLFVESAWEGNGGEWKRGVGHYSDDESADLRALVAYAKENGVPTVFWNKEDPVHFARFAPNAALFDHVFTTDANMIPEYLGVPGCKNVSVSSLPFYAQPKIHNPLPVSREFDNTIAYAGTYYGQRYEDRSKGLDQLLEAATKYGLAIYDRQADIPDSPYTFPSKYAPAVRGSLPYTEVLKSYASHIAQLNVSSVTDSPTMFSRRVVEIPACGGVVLSSPSRGISETLGPNIASSNAKEEIDAWMLNWTQSAEGRLEEIWRQMRTIYRSHTTDTAMAIMCRTAGIPVRGVTLPTYCVTVSNPSTELIESLLEQSVRPSAIAGDLAEQQRVQVREQGIRVDAGSVKADYTTHVDKPVSRTHFEDLLLATRFGEWGVIQPLNAESFANGDSVCVPIAPDEITDAALIRSENADNAKAVGVFMAPDTAWGQQEQVENELASLPAGATVLVAGHDLKFAQSTIAALTANGYKVLLDQWESHTKHDEDQSMELLSQADVVFCEWGLGNVVWYSHHVRPDQRLVVRVHSQELFRPYLKQIDTSSVEKFVFVGELIRDAAVISHGIPEEKTVIIPNPVDVGALKRPKKPTAEFGIGFVGIVPRSKRLDRALDVLEALQKKDQRFHLRIKGKTPEDYPWMANRPEEMAFYDEQYDRIATLNNLKPGSVIFDGFGPDMADWYRNVGFVLSVSDFESFHLTLADGAASGAIPYSIAWPGADLIYPLEWLSASTDELAQALICGEVNSEDASQFVKEHFAQEDVLERLVALITRQEG
ncbi:glycosyltransferase [Corynebacterium coyleae]